MLLADLRIMPALDHLKSVKHRKIARIRAGRRQDTQPRIVLVGKSRAVALTPDEIGLENAIGAAAARDLAASSAAAETEEAALVNAVARAAARSLVS